MPSWTPCAHKQTGKRAGPAHLCGPRPQLVEKAARTFPPDFLPSSRQKFHQRGHSQGRSVRTGAGGTYLVQTVAAHPPRGNPVSLEGTDSDLLPPPARACARAPLGCRCVKGERASAGWPSGEARVQPPAERLLARRCGARKITAASDHTGSSGRRSK